MIKIDTEYAALNQVDPEIVRFYGEDPRNRVTGHTAPDENGSTTPITEDYTVIVLHKPDEVSFDYVESRRGRRLGEDVAKAALVQAIAWNDFATNHDSYLTWLEDYRAWEMEQPTEMIGEEEVLIAAPSRPVIDIADQRAVYEQLEQSYDANLFTVNEFTTEHDDEQFTSTRVPVLIDKPAAEVVAYHEAKAKAYREELVERNISHNGIEYQVSVFDLRNIQDAIYEAEHEGYPADHAQMWIAADNSLHELTVDDLKAIRSLKAKRKQETYEAYALWRLGDKLTPFDL